MALRRSRGAALVVGGLVASVILGGCAASEPTEAAPSVGPVGFAPPAPAVASTAAGTSSFSERADAAWLTSTAESTGIPRRALAAYAAATLVSNAENPSCGASWNTLAGIGYVESHHGEVFGGAIGDDGRATPEIFGVPLDGGDTANIPDSDGGALDDDPTIDRAVGPMQLIPDTWRNWHNDADGDGVEDVHDIDDAALAAVHYVCRAGGDLRLEEGRRTGILAWNRSETYLRDVAARATRYADDAAD